MGNVSLFSESMQLFVKSSLPLQPSIYWLDPGGDFIVKQQQKIQYQTQVKKR